MIIFFDFWALNPSLDFRAEKCYTGLWDVNAKITNITKITKTKKYKNCDKCGEKM